MLPCIFRENDGMMDLISCYYHIHACFSIFIIQVVSMVFCKFGWLFGMAKNDYLIENSLRIIKIPTIKNTIITEFIYNNVHLFLKIESITNRKTRKIQQKKRIFWLKVTSIPRSIIFSFKYGFQHTFQWFSLVQCYFPLQIKDNTNSFVIYPLNFPKQISFHLVIGIYLTIFNCIQPTITNIAHPYQLIDYLLMNQRLIQFALVLFLVAYSHSASKNYTKLIHNTDPDAKCLDGSPPMIYLHEGGDTKNIMFYFIGGGACMGTDLPSTLESCYKRSKGRLGTSKTWPDQYDATGAGFLETDPAKSRFANWTKIVIMYCDGSFHQGNNKSPIQYKDAQLYFRGAVNTRSHFKWADNKYGLSKASKIIVSGSSAGGMSTYLWVDYVRTLVPNPKVVYGVADSGIFYDPLVNRQLSVEQNRKYLGEMFLNAENKLLGLETVETSNDKADPNPIQILMQLSNVDERPPNKQCSSLFTEDEVWKCIFVQFSYATLKYPILFIQSSYDQFVIQDALMLKCLVHGDSGYTPKNCKNWEMDIIQLYRSQYIDKFVPNLLKWGHSIWSISCVWHAEMPNSLIYDSNLQKVPKDQGPTMRTAVQNFVFDEKRIIAVDLFPWPANTPCSY